MTQWGRAFSPLLLVLGAGLVAHAALTRGAHLSLVLIVPIVSGDSAEFSLGVLLIALGVFLLPWSLLGSIESEPPQSRLPTGADDARSESSGGVLLLGPIPIFFGSWRSPSRARYWVAVGVGLALFLVVVALFLLL
jgi:uncharacterized membrane protein